MDAENRRKLNATLIVIVKSAAIFAIGHLVATWLSELFPAAGAWIEKAILILLFLPLLYFVWKPFAEEIGIAERGPDGGSH